MCIIEAVSINGMRDQSFKTNIDWHLFAIFTYYYGVFLTSCKTNFYINFKIYYACS